MKKSIFIIIAVMSILTILFLVGCTAKTGETCNVKTGECSGQVSDVKTVEKQEVKATEVKEDKTEVKAEEKKELYAFKIAVKEGELVKLKVNAEDPEKEKLTYTYSQPLNEKGEWQTKRGDKGNYEVTVTVSDGKNNVQSKGLIIVEEKPNTAPVVSVPELIEIKEGETAAFTVNATDADKDKLLIAVYDKRFEQKENTFSWKTTYTDAGNYSVEVEVSDGTNSVEKKIVIKVADNQPPVIKEITKI